MAAAAATAAAVAVVVMLVGAIGVYVVVEVNANEIMRVVFNHVMLSSINTIQAKCKLQKDAPKSLIIVITFLNATT